MNMTLEALQIIAAYEAMDPIEKLQVLSVGVAMVESVKGDTLEETLEFAKELHEAANS